MSDRAKLRVGDKIRIVAVPKDDLAALEPGSTYLKETVSVLKWMVGKEFNVDSIDEYGNPWVYVAGYPDPEGGEHFMAIFDSESWVPVNG